MQNMPVKNKRKYSSGHAETIKAFQVGQIITSSMTEIAGIWQNANTNPINALIPGWGPAFAAIQTGITIARAAIGVSNIQKQKFADGGYLRGASHADGGIKMVDSKTGQIVGEAEGDELILSKMFVKNNPELSNQLYLQSVVKKGAARYADGGYIAPSLYGVPLPGATQSNNQGGMNNAEMANLIAQAVAGAISKLDIRSKVVYTDLTDVGSTIDFINSKADN